VSQIAVSSGALTLSESYLYTVEAMMDYFRGLAPDGIIYFSNPIIDAERFVTTIREAFRRIGREEDFVHSIFIADNHFDAYRKCKVLVKPDGFTRSEVKKLRRKTGSAGHTVLYCPEGITREKTSKSPEDLKKKELPETAKDTALIKKTIALPASLKAKESDNPVRRLVLAQDMQAEYDSSGTEIRPSTDNWPFFTQRAKPGARKLTEAIKKIDYFYPVPFLFLKKSTKFIVLFALAFLVLPLLVLNFRGFKGLKQKVSGILFFISIGLGFMFLEIVLMQKYVLILGYPIYSFAIVLAGLLISSGIGSLLSRKFRDPRKAIRIGLFGIIGATALSILFSKFLGSAVIALPFVLRILIALVMIGLNGLFMGFMMPSGLRLISHSDASIPWMYSINSVFSVVGSYTAVYLSVIMGFTFVLLLAIGIYIIGSLCILFLKI